MSTTEPEGEPAVEWPPEADEPDAEPAHEPIPRDEPAPDADT